MTILTNSTLYASLWMALSEMRGLRKNANLVEIGSMQITSILYNLHRLYGLFCATNFSTHAILYNYSSLLYGKNDISSVKFMSLPLTAIVFYMPKSFRHFGKLMQTNEVVALLRMRRLSRRCGWIIYI
jgi:hypothetical protein